MDSLLKFWNGPRWRLAALIGGFLSVPASILVGLAASSVTGEDLTPLVMLVLVILILAASLVGSGFIDTLTSNLSRGGLAREATDHVEETLSTSEREQAALRNQELRDRRTIRAGLFVIAPLIAFVYLMTIV